MKFISNWRDVAKRSHSMWSMYLGLLALIVPDLLYALIGWDTPPRLWFLAGLGLLIYGVFGRLINQRIDRSKVESNWIVGVIAIAFAGLIYVTADDRAGSQVSVIADPEVSALMERANSTMPATDAQFAAVAVPFIGKWEGLRLEAYKDIVGVWTICYGETKGVRAGQRHTKQQCDAMLRREAVAYRKGLHKHMTAQTRASRLPVGRDVAFTSLAYNVGVSGAGKSTAVRRLNAGDVAGACEALTWWNKAGGRVIRGLVRRRTEERDLCVAGAA